MFHDLLVTRHALSSNLVGANTGCVLRHIVITLPLTQS